VEDRLANMGLINSEATCGAARWYVVHTNAKQEARAASNLRAWRVETFTPKLKERRDNLYTGVPAFVIKPLFPRYIFARFEAGTLLHKVCFTRGVRSVINFGGIPTQVDDEVISIIQSQVGKGGYIQVDEKLRLGDKVMINDGPLKSLFGIFERETKDADRVALLLTAVNYQCRVVIERELVKKVG